MLYLNGQPVPVTIFPDKTSQVWKIPNFEKIVESGHAHIRWVFESESEFMHLAQLQYLLSMHTVKTSLSLPYLPYGRQDKPAKNDATFALRAFAFSLNQLEFEWVNITDPHSEIALTYINNSSADYPQGLVERIAQMKESTIFCYPDKGALTKYSKVYEQSYRDYIYGEKVRDQLTGNILSYKVVGDCAGKNVLIVDDICDGGATFKLLAKDLLAAGAKEVNLFVTHGLFTRGLQVLKDAGINRIFCQDGECFEEPGADWWTKNI